MLDEDDGGLLCHECGRRFTHLGLHAWRGHGMTTDEYRSAHGLSRSRGLIASATREAIEANARPGQGRKITVVVCEQGGAAF